MKLIVPLVLALAATARADDQFELKATDATVEVGGQTSISLTIAPAAGKVVSHDGPLKLELGGGDGLALTRRRYARKDAADPAADAPRFDLKIKATAAGDHTIDVDARFWLCGPKVCRPIRAKRTVTVHVTEPAAPPPPP
ncbi:MAG TPA: hypothetical protein VL463_02270 [Kofleriaceae bacterium]|nr:hypothetical protein [Kofleriaceae bacterium]